MSEPTSVVSRPARFSLDTWAVAVATAFVILIVAGILPRVPW